MKGIILVCLVLMSWGTGLAQTIRDATDESPGRAAPVRRSAVPKAPISTPGVDVHVQPQPDPSPVILGELAARQRVTDSLRATVASLQRKLPTEENARLRYEAAVDYAWKILVIWLILTVIYLVWAINRYVCNLGLSNREWKVLHPEIYETWFDRAVFKMFGKMANLKSYRERRDEWVESEIKLHTSQGQMDSEDAIIMRVPPPAALLAEPEKNPYERDSFGLPPGSVRGILAMTALVMFLLIEGVNLYAPGNLEDQFGGLVTALQMVLAFYFGSKAVEALQAKSNPPAETKAVVVAAPAPPEVQSPPQPGQGAPPQVASPVPAPDSQPAAEEPVLPASSSSTRFSNLVVLSSDTSSTPAAKDTLSESTPLVKRALALTASIETGAGFPQCFAGISGNFDGQGISYGALQWNMGQGTLQSLWSEMRESNETEMITVLGDLYKEFSKMLDSPKTDQMKWALGIQRLAGGRANAWQIIDKWKIALQALGKSPGMIDVQVKRADSLFHIGLAACKEYGLTLERGAALMFDIRVQNGAVDRGGAGAKIRADFDQLNPNLSDLDMQVERMRIIARRRAEVSSAQWRNDVMTRKMTIAEGTGKIHGKVYDLEKEFAIGLRPLTDTPATPAARPAPQGVSA